MADELMLLSNSAMHGMKPLEHALEAVQEFLDGCRTVHFVPYALADHARYTAGVAASLAPLGVTVVGLHETEPRAAVESADVLFVGGGNSFRLLRALYHYGLVEPVQRRVAAGSLRYMGSSAGTNMACPSLRTTNDMPIVQPESFAAFGLVPFQINPHYLDANPHSTHGGETREQRIGEFLEENDVPVLGLREGTWLRRQDRRLHLHGLTSARLFRRGAEPADIAPDTDLSSLLDATPRFDTPQYAG
jgi:dipeptidase E